MLAFFKEKPRLKDLLGGNFIDIHSHLLPGIDDGAKTIADTLRLAKAFEGIGVDGWVVLVKKMARRGKGGLIGPCA